MVGSMITSSSPRVLVVDDRMDSVALLLDFLKGHRFDVMAALSGEDGLRKALAGQPDAILLDVSMPGMGGYEACRRIKREPALAAVPVIFLSACDTVESKLHGFAAGGVDYVSKPFCAQEVLARLFVHLRRAYPPSLSGVGLPPAHPRSRDDEIVHAAETALRRKNASWPGLSELAHQIGTNERKLTDLFKQQFGMTVYEYLMNLRLEAARAELGIATRHIQQIAFDAGYGNASDFSRAFRQRYGLSPREYRRASAQSGPGMPPSADDPT